MDGSGPSQLACGVVAAVNGVVGPIPSGADPEQYDKLRRRVMWAMPSGLYLIGSAAGDEANLMTANWVTQVSSEPKLVAASIETEAVTRRLVANSGIFGVSILSREDRPVVRHFSKPAEWDAAAKTLHKYPVELHHGVPMLGSAAAWLVCQVRQQTDLGSHVLFVGEVVDCWARDEIGEVLRMEDTRMSYGG